jgi:hypothetical protein
VIVGLDRERLEHRLHVVAEDTCGASAGLRVDAGAECRSFGFGFGGGPPTTLANSRSSADARRTPCTLCEADLASERASRRRPFVVRIYTAHIASLQDALLPPVPCARAAHVRCAAGAGGAQH